VIFYTTIKKSQLNLMGVVGQLHITALYNAINLLIPGKSARLQMLNQDRNYDDGPLETRG